MKEVQSSLVKGSIGWLTNMLDQMRPEHSEGLIYHTNKVTAETIVNLITNGLNKLMSQNGMIATLGIGSVVTVAGFKILTRKTDDFSAKTKSEQEQIIKSTLEETINNKEELEHEKNLIEQFFKIQTQNKLQKLEDARKEQGSCINNIIQKQKGFEDKIKELEERLIAQEKIVECIERKTDAQIEALNKQASILDKHGVLLMKLTEQLMNISQDSQSNNSANNNEIKTYSPNIFK